MRIPRIFRYYSDNLIDEACVMCEVERRLATDNLGSRFFTLTLTFLHGLLGYYHLIDLSSHWKPAGSMQKMASGHVVSNNKAKRFKTNYLVTNATYCHALNPGNCE